MAQYKTVDVTLALDILRIWSADDRYRGVEPYVIPIFFKVDGERYLASLRINHSQQPIVLGEQPAGQIQLSVDTVEPDTSPLAEKPDIHENKPFIWVPPGNLLGRGSLDSGEQIIMRDVFFTSKLIPIPFRIDVGGVYMTLVEALYGLLVRVESDAVALNTVFVNLNELIGELFGLNEVLDTCPTKDLGLSEFLNDIDAQFKAMIPGTIGGVFVCMENDAFNEDLTHDLRSSVKDQVAFVINYVINLINLDNLVPEVDRVTDATPLEDYIGSDLTGPVIADIGISLGAIVASALSGNVALGFYGILTGLSWIAGGKDDAIGVVTVNFNHSNLGPPGSLTLRSKILETEDDDDDNRWELSYTLKVNSVA